MKDPESYFVYGLTLGNYNKIYTNHCHCHMSDVLILEPSLVLVFLVGDRSTFYCH